MCLLPAMVWIWLGSHCGDIEVVQFLRDEASGGTQGTGVQPLKGSR